MNFLLSQTYLEDLDEIRRATDGCPLRGRILITGANGLISTVLADFLSRLPDVEVYVLCRSSERSITRFGKRVKYIIQDVTEPFKTSVEFDYIIHAASNAHPAAYAAYPADTIKANTLGTINILEHARNYNSKRVMFVSSSEVYGMNNTDKPLKEDDYGYIDISNPRNAYSEGKRAGETLCTAYFNQYGMNTVCVRPGYVFGATFNQYNSRADAQFFRKSIMGEDIVLKSAGLQRRSYIYVPDCVSAILRILVDGYNGAYNIAGSEHTSIREFADMIAAAANVNVVYEEMDENEKASGSPVFNSVLAAERLSEIGFNSKFSVKLGIERTIQILDELKI
jgi:nucleoside-diphosphate-sugar epimerase